MEEDINEIGALLVVAEKLVGHPNLGNLRKAVLDRLAELNDEWEPEEEAPATTSAPMATKGDKNG